MKRRMSVNAMVNDTNASSALRAAIIGAGLMGRWHADAVRRAGHRVTVVIDSQAQARTALAAACGAQAYASFDSALVPSIDVVHICTPLDTHVAFAQVALEAGLHVVVEKPLAPAADDCAQLYTAAENANRFVMPVHQFPFQQGALQAGTWINQIGRILRLEGRFFSAGAALGKGSPDAILADVLPHPLSLMYRFAGALPDTWHVIHPGEGECHAAALVQHNQHPVALDIVVSMNARPTLAWFTIIGTNGTLHLDLFHGYAVLESGAVSTTQKITRPFTFAGRLGFTAGMNLIGRAMRGEIAYPGLRRLIADFYNAIQSGSDSPLSAAEVLATARARDAILQNANPPV